MIPYIEEMLQVMQSKSENESTDAAEKEQLSTAMESMKANLDKLKPVIDAHAKEYADLQQRDTEMEKLIHEMKNSLLIEKIKMDTWENRKSSK